MISQYLKQLGNINLLHVAMLVGFFILFLAIVYMVIKGKNTIYEGFGDIPLETENENNHSHEKTE
jgi:hypothetical protein